MSRSHQPFEYDLPTFSLCHATARLPDGWRAAHESWKQNCDNWSGVEYVLGVDLVDSDKWPALEDDIQPAINKGRQCAVDGWNAAGKAATGRFLITVADDCFPPPHWDTELLKVIPNLDGEYAIEVKSGTSPADDEWMRCMLHSFITRNYYKRIGNFFSPQYQGMYADVDFTDMARRDGVVIDARHLTFQHRHWIGTRVPYDEIYQRQNAQARYDEGFSILGRRREEGFKNANF